MEEALKKLLSSMQEDCFLKEHCFEALSCLSEQVLDQDDFFDELDLSWLTELCALPHRNIPGFYLIVRKETYNLLMQTSLVDKKLDVIRHTFSGTITLSAFGEQGPVISADFCNEEFDAQDYLCFFKKESADEPVIGFLKKRQH